jgi:quinol monooxygenase YgiN
MLAVVATIKVKPGQGAEFEAVAKELASKVNENEKGCLLYVLCKGDQPDTYYFLERYADEAAIEAHRNSAHFKELGRKMGQYMEGRPELLRLKQV